MQAVEQAIKEARAYLCVSCGKCTGACPVALLKPGFSPRAIVERVTSYQPEDLLHENALWDCVTCAACNLRCPQNVDFTDFIKHLRVERHRQDGEGGPITHGGTLHALMRISAAANIQQKRLDWLDPALEVDPNSEIVYYVGCAPYYDSYFADIGSRALSAANSAIKVLNHLGITPAVLPNERCCGHDLLWCGDEPNFKKLAEQNQGAFKERGTKKVLVSCPECYQTLKTEYPRYAGRGEHQVVHLASLLHEALAEGKLKVNDMAGNITYHDSCRIGRYSGLYEEPRALLGAMSGLNLTEMAYNRTRSLCCGTHSWMNCDVTAKQMQTNVLKEAKSTGADTLVTSCPKCQIHFRCTMQDASFAPEDRIEVKDLFTLVASSLSQ